MQLFSCHDSHIGYQSVILEILHRKLPTCAPGMVSLSQLNSNDDDDGVAASCN